MNQIAPISVRSARHPVDPIFLERWSPRSFDGTPLTEEQILTILEAASWAPSAYNAQPWRFVYALRGKPEFDALLGTRRGPGTRARSSSSSRGPTSTAPRRSRSTATPSTPVPHGPSSR